MCDPSRILLTSSFVFICVLTSDSYEQRDGNNNKLLTEGSSCQQLGVPGICEKAKNCPIALDALQNKGRHELKRCGFEGSQEIVCCPDLSDRNPVSETTDFEGYIFSGDAGSTKAPSENVGNQGRLKTKRKCEKMCEKIYSENNIKPVINFHILNGDNATKGQFPHAVALGFENADQIIEWNCGASLISSKFLLTAAHCFICNGCSDPKKARLGIIDITDSKSAQDVDVKNVIPHPQYNPTSKQNDIGIIELVKDVIMSKLVYPACLYTEIDDPLGLQIIGWGQTVSNDASSKAVILQYAVIQPVPVEDCNITLVRSDPYSSKVIRETQICATTKSDACTGDSGGPLQIQKPTGGYAVVGVVSYGVQCGTKIPGIYTRVARYLDWVEQMVWPG